VTRPGGNLPSAQSEALLNPFDITPEDRVKAALYVCHRLGDVESRRDVLEALGLIEPADPVEKMDKPARQRIARARRRQEQRIRERAEKRGTPGGDVGDDGEGAA
jgi:hypothetical protein